MLSTTNRSTTKGSQGLVRSITLVSILFAFSHANGETDPALTPQDGESLTIGDRSGGAVAIDLNSTKGVSLVIEGKVEAKVSGGSAATGIRVRKTENTTIDVKNGGSINAEDAIQGGPDESEIENIDISNAGTISGAIDLRTIKNYSITNNGKIINSINSGIFIQDANQGNIKNTGTIRSKSGSAIEKGSINEDLLITNSGTIEGKSKTIGLGEGAIKRIEIKNSGDIKTSSGDDAVNLTISADGTVSNTGTIESNKDNAVNIGGLDQGESGIARSKSMTVTNSGTIEASGNNGIRATYAEDATIENTATGTITAKTDAVDLGHSIGSKLTNKGTIQTSEVDAVDADNVDGAKVINIGTIQANGNDAIELDFSTNSTITNAGTIEADSEAIDGSGSDKLVLDNSGVIRAAQNTIRLNNNSTLTNTGRVVASDNNADAILVDGTGTTVTLDEGSEVIGGIKTDKAGNTLEIDVGSARSVVYETNGDWELTFADGRPGIEGSVVTAGIGQLETSDELMHRHFADLRDSLKRLEPTGDATATPIQVDAYRGREKREAGQDGTRLEKYELRTTALTLALPMRVLDIAQPYANYSESALDIDGNAHQIDVQSVRLGLRQPALLTVGKLSISGRIAIGRNFHDGDREVLVNNNGASGTERQTTSWRSDIAELALNAEYHQTIAPSIQLRINPELAAQHQRIEAYRESEAFFWKKRSLTQAHAALALGIDYAAEPDTTLSVEARGWRRELLSGETADYRLNTTDVSYTDPTTSDQGLEVSIGLSKRPSDNVRIQAHLTGHRTDTGTDGAVGAVTLVRQF